MSYSSSTRRMRPAFMSGTIGRMRAHADTRIRNVQATGPRGMRATPGLHDAQGRRPTALFDLVLEVDDVFNARLWDLRPHDRSLAGRLLRREERGHAVTAQVIGQMGPEGPEALGIRRDPPGGVQAVHDEADPPVPIEAAEEAVHGRLLDDLPRRPPDDLQSPRTSIQVEPEVARLLPQAGGAFVVADVEHVLALPQAGRREGEADGGLAGTGGTHQPRDRPAPHPAAGHDLQAPHTPGPGLVPDAVRRLAEPAGFHPGVDAQPLLANLEHVLARQRERAA